MKIEGVNENFLIQSLSFLEGLYKQREIERVLSSR